MPNPFAHVELNTDDVKKAKKFYQAVFAWKLTDMPGAGYTMIDVGGGMGGGMQNKQMPEAPTAWLSYVKVDDIKAVMAKAVKAGATSLVPYQEIGNMGAIGIFTDPAGAMLGLWEEAKAPPAAPPPTAANKGAAPSKKKIAAPAAPEPAKKAPSKKAPAAASPPAPASPPAKKSVKKAAPPPPPPPVAKKAPAKKAAPAPTPAPNPSKKAPAKKK